MLVASRRSSGTGKVTLTCFCSSGPDGLQWGCFLVHFLLQLQRILQLSTICLSTLKLVFSLRTLLKECTTFYNKRYTLNDLEWEDSYVHYLIPRCFLKLFCMSKKPFWSKNISQKSIKAIGETKAFFVLLFSLFGSSKTTFQWCNSFHARCGTLRLVKVINPLSLQRVDLENTASQTHLNNINEGDLWTAGRTLQWQCFKRNLTGNHTIRLYSHWVLLSKSHLWDIVVGNVAISDVFCI